MGSKGGDRGGSSTIAAARDLSSSSRTKWWTLSVLRQGRNGGLCLSFVKDEMVDSVCPSAMAGKLPHATERRTGKLPDAMERRTGPKKKEGGGARSGFLSKFQRLARPFLT